MPLMTRAIADGIPLRVHEQKKKGTVKKKPTIKKIKKSAKKRQAESDSESGDGSEPESVREPTPGQRQRKKKAKRCHVGTEDEESDVEVVETDVEPLPSRVEEIDDISGDEQQVSMMFLLKFTTKLTQGWPQRPSMRHCSQRTISKKRFNA